MRTQGLGADLLSLRLRSFIMNAKGMSLRRWSVYLVRCADGSLYTGISTDVEARVRTHNAGKGAAYTRSRRPVELAWSEEVPDESTARKREYAVKRLSREGKVALIQGLRH